MNALTKFTLAFLCLTASTGYASAASSHCTTDETIVFSCRVGKNTVSVCASADGSPTGGTLQYRFGPTGSAKLDMSIPEPAAHPNTAITAGSLMYSGGGGAYMRFTQGTYAYVVYTGTGRGWEKEGVAVEKNGTLSTSYPCKDSAVSLMGSAFFEKIALPVDETNDFDMSGAR